MLFFSILFLCLAFSASAFDLQGGISPDPKKFLQKYALLKLHEACFGQENMFKMKQRTKEAAAFCQSQPVEEGLFYGQLPIRRNGFLSQFVSTAAAAKGEGKEWNKPSESYYGAAARDRMTPWSDSVKVGQGGGSVDKITRKWSAKKQQMKKTYSSPSSPSLPLLYSFGVNGPGRVPLPHQHPFPLHHYQHRQSPFHQPMGYHHLLRRQVEDQDAEASLQLAGLREQVLARLSNVTCALRRVGVATEDGRIDQEQIRREYQQMPGLDPLMRSEIVSSVSTCASYSTCLADTADSPSSSSSVLLRGGAVAPLVMFVNCFKGKKMEACIKRDLRERLAAFVEGGIDGDEEEELLSTSRSDNVDETSKAEEDMEAFLFAILYEDEPADLL